MSVLLKQKKNMHPNKNAFFLQVFVPVTFLAILHKYSLYYNNNDF